MGNAASSTNRPPAYWRLEKAIPPVKDCGLDNNYNWVDRGIKPFKSEVEREQFIFSLMTVLSSNGNVNIQKNDFKIIYTRRQPDHANPPPPSSPFSWNKKPSDRIFASLVLLDECGNIKSKIEPGFGGKDQAEAFQLFKKHIEILLDKVLADVASMEPKANAAPDVSRQDEVPMGVLFDVAPPSYEKLQRQEKELQH